MRFPWSNLGPKGTRYCIKCHGWFVIPENYQDTMCPNCYEVIRLTLQLGFAEDKVRSFSTLTDKYHQELLRKEEEEIAKAKQVIAKAEGEPK